MYPRYPLPLKKVLPIALGALFVKPRSIHQDAVRLTEEIKPPLRLRGEEHIPDHGPCLITMNHYFRPGFQGLWIGLAVSAVIPLDIHWVMTAAWTFPGSPLKPILKPLSRWLFRRVARAYDFTPMPAMPPDPDEVEERAEAVRHLLAFCRMHPTSIIGLAPEGMDMPGGKVSVPPTGVGRLIYQLANRRMPILPIGIYEEAGELCLQVGASYRLEMDEKPAPSQRESLVSHTVMNAIAAQLPLRLRGDFTGEEV